ncbi:choice-of-anchor H family protein [Colwellia piezophila]|uniref:choice-of-anchor H family protein n=1 Tax=Colwellia piezophila TaxID=211668 RepID=UPI001FDECA51|nr:choice-of-anchor H family protein [Colwellia piezophila]
MMKQFIKYLPFISVLRNTDLLSAKILTSLPLILLFLLMTMALPSVAEQVDSAKADSTELETKQNYSSGQSVNDINKTSANTLLQKIRQRIALGDSDQALNKASKLSRQAFIAQKHQQARDKTAANLYKNRAKMASMNSTSRSFSDGSFIIYEGYSQLIEDYDGDGYYQTFSVTFDADLITYSAFDEAIVYAELYLSENGGPWQHYYSTDSFIIQGESSDDSFEVYSTLMQGFNPNHYDVLIDLYEEGYPNIIASYSSDDSNSLYALPLESSDYDTEYVEYYDETHVHAGNYSLALLLLMILTLLIGRGNPKASTFN